MTAAAPAMVVREIPAGHIVGHKLDSIPFSAYHIVLIVVLGFVGFIEPGAQWFATCVGKRTTAPRPR
jgi:hypothetical protein